MAHGRLFHVVLTYAAFGMVEKNGIVVDAAPIARWTLGRRISFVRDYWRERGELITWTLVPERHRPGGPISANQTNDCDERSA